MQRLLQAVARNWWVLVLRGVLAMLFGFAAWAWPGRTLAVLVLLWGLYALVDGVFAVVNGLRMRWWSVVLFGALGILAGGYTLVRPGVTALTLLLLIGCWAIVRGLLEIVAAFQLRKEIDGEWLFLLGGVASVAFGVMVVMSPGAGALAAAWLIGAYALVIGALLVGLGLRLRAAGRLLEAPATA